MILHWIRAILVLAATGLRVVLDTDLGDDIDDTWALSALLQTPTVELRLVVADSFGAWSHACAVAKFLRLAGRSSQVPELAIGPQRVGRTVMETWATAQDLKAFPGQVRSDAPQAIIEQVQAAARDDVPLQILVLSPSFALAAALREAPWIAQKAQITAMGGSLWHGTNGTGPPLAEWSVKADVASSLEVYPHVSRLCPLDVAGTAQIDGAEFQELLNCQGQVPVVKALLEMYWAWLPRCPWRSPLDGPKGPADHARSSVIYDLAAATMLPVYSSEFMELREVNLTIDSQGFTHPDGRGGWPMVAGVSWRRQMEWEKTVVQLLCTRGAAAKVIL
ncbi:IU_nuc_hydro domain-containing protein [Durusdinium trenchii]|uniref:IU_nuc_hydro domain-containing protein n=1 Tax=Durusdinium trenchii TaxID=1381693 RepID=A0ABP0J2J8_9DINO